MTEREQLEFAAKACGIAHVDYTGINYSGSLGLEKVNHNGKHIGTWNPLHDQADSDRMGCKLKIALQYGEPVGLIPGVVVVCNPYVRVKHDNTDEDVCRAVREARMLVAVEIGRGMK